MRKYRDGFNLTRHNLYLWLQDERMWILGAFVILLMFRYLNGLNLFAEDYGTRVTPYLLPVIFGESRGANGSLKVLVYLGGILLFSNAPFMDGSTVSYLCRSGRKRWLNGEAAYIVCAAGIYMLYLMLVSMLVVLRSSVWNDGWGSTIRELNRMYAKDPTSWQGYMPLFLSDVTKRIVPGTAQLYTFLTGWCSFILLGLLIFRFSLSCTTAVPGMVAAAVPVFADPLIHMQGVYHPYWYLFSPVSWSSMETLDVVDPLKKSGFLSVFLGYALLILLLYGLCRRKAGKMDILAEGKE